MSQSVVRQWVVGLSVAVSLSGCAQQALPVEDPVRLPAAQERYVSFPALGSSTPIQVAGRLGIPRNVEGKVPAVVIAHGTRGVDRRGIFYSEALYEAGIAVLEIDMWSARGLPGGVDGRAASVIDTMPDAYGALKFLSQYPSIDASRIGIMGFSWGGVMSMLTATQKYAAMAESGQHFAAHAPFYPVCWAYNKVPDYEFVNLTGAPVFMQVGEIDGYDDPDSCQKLMDGLSAVDRPFVEMTVYPGATHAWDRLEPYWKGPDAYAHAGRGGDVELIPSPETAEKSKQAVVAFFKKAFGITQ